MSIIFIDSRLEVIPDIGSKLETFRRKAMTERNGLAKHNGQVTGVVAVVKI